MNLNGYRPSLISWNLTKKCNLRCPHCYMEAGQAAENELTTDECLELIGEMKALGTEMLILTGGEPLLRKDIYEIARYASDQRIWVVMGTNGVLITEDRKSTRLNSSHGYISYAVFCLKKKK